MRPSRRAVAAALAAGTALAACTGIGGAAAAPRAAADPPPQLKVLVTAPDRYVTPLQFAVGKRVYVADAARSLLFKVGSARPIASGPAPDPKNQEDSGSLDGVAVRGGSVAYTTTEKGHRNTYLTVLRQGKQVLRVNLGAYERRQNPDGVVTYGTAPSTLPKGCRAQLVKTGAPIRYTGQKDSHPYAVEGLADGSWLVADAGANDVLKVSPSGDVSTVAVLPKQPVHVSTALAAALHAPACAGIVYRFESVPTDVESGPDGIYVTTLPGGFGGSGSVYRIGDDGAGPTRVATGFAQATNLAVAPDGTVYVAELGKGISAAVDGRPYQVIALKNVAAVEYAKGHLYASTAPAAASEGKDTSPGRLVVLGPKAS